jgi:FAD/FMN-containing dehydrogenase
MPPPSLAVDRLRAELKGVVITPGDEGYDRARTVFSGAIDRRPAVIARPLDAAEVSRVVLVARDTGLPLAVRSGGHGNHSVCDDGIVLDLAGVRAAYPGATWERLVAVKRRYDPSNLFRLNQTSRPPDPEDPYGGSTRGTRSRRRRP